MNVSGTYRGSGQCTRTGTGKGGLILGDDVSFRNVSALTVEQIGCTLKLQVTGDEGVVRNVSLDHDLEWTEKGVAYRWKPGHHSSSILPGTSSETRTLLLQLSPQNDSITLTSAYDERGVALLFVPFHDHNEISCVMARAR